MTSLETLQEICAARTVNEFLVTLKSLKTKIFNSKRILVYSLKNVKICHKYDII